MRFTKDHEWIRLEGDIATVGITAFAAGQLGDIVFVELPEVGRKIARGEAFAVVESVKAASDVFAPVSGEVVDANPVLGSNPETVNGDAENAGWLARIRLDAPDELDGLMDRAAYDAFLEDR